jgi:preprotein translocase subunit YajC
MPTLILVVVLFIFAWIFLVLPSRRRQRSHTAMQESVGVGDEIITAGGIHGVIREEGGEDVQLEIAPGIVVTLDRRAIAAVAQDESVEDDQVEDADRDDGEEEDQAEESLKG